MSYTHVMDVLKTIRMSVLKVEKRFMIQQGIAKS